MSPWDDVLWWLMLGTAIAAAAISVTTSVLDRHDSVWPGRRERYLLHMLGYLLMGLSMLIFVLRGILAPP